MATTENKKDSTKTEEKDKKRVWVPGFGKYLDELTDEEWQEMANATCDDPLKDCE
ncbi:hypothetical protein [Mesoplasma lactucae]|uniref:hypothetical protein n=1 Tax=Mesoplasma lactucae TaxID=138853 RepID=UPI000CA1A3F2|nr:hypothetical protein [Mesoplasma lactucae]ATZ20319.1 hypothetical protein MLACT_v1c04980 [Mesoplasma lactucae ATCC 49193]MCL8216490.1 hypothetical protein [Mesoplasma lactucae ATCC 49193]